MNDTLQKQAYLTTGLGKVGTESRENPKIYGEASFVEDDNVNAGRFVFSGTAGNQSKGVATAGTTPTGVAIFPELQMSLNGVIGTKLNVSNIFRKLKKGYCFMQCDGGSLAHKNHILVDPTTGDIFGDASTSKVAGAGKEVFENVNTTVANWTAITSGNLIINIDGTDTTLTGLNFGSASAMSDVAIVLTTAFSSAATAAYNSSTGLTITSATTGASSKIEVVSGDDAIITLLGMGITTKGNNALNDSGWLINQASIDGKVIEAYKE